MTAMEPWTKTRHVRQYPMPMWAVDKRLVSSSADLGFKTQMAILPMAVKRRFSLTLDLMWAALTRGWANEADLPAS